MRTFCLSPKFKIMEVDHIFIFSDNQGKEAQELIDFGFTEGDSRIH